MKQNPYESPKSPPTLKGGIAIGVLLLFSIPAGCVCGGVMCSAVSAAGVASFEGPEWPGKKGDFAGILVGLVIVVLIPMLAVLLFGKRKAKP